MKNPMLQQMQPTQAPAANNPMQMIQAFMQFRQQMAGKNPRQMVEQLVQSGQMTQDQLQQLEQQAQSMLSMFGR